MARAKPTHIPTPRILSSPHQVAALFGHGEEWFRQRRARLEAAGFPRHDDLLGGWDGEAIHVWLDRRSGIAQHSSTDGEPNPWDEASGNGQGESAVC